MDGLFLPSGLCAVLMLAGLAAITWRRTRPLGTGLLAVAAVLVLLFSSGAVSTSLMVPLERGFQPVTDVRQHPHARVIVVLTGWATDDTRQLPSARLNPSSAYRVLAAMELWRQRPESPVIVSGAARTVRVMAATLRSLGLPEDKLVLDENAWNTSDSATNLKGRLGQEEFFLVTSAGHMPRALGAFEKQGLAAIAVPTDFHGPPNAGAARWFPQASSLADSDMAIHEYVAQFWYRITGRS